VDVSPRCRALEIPFNASLGEVAFVTASWKLQAIGRRAPKVRA